MEEPVIIHAKPAHQVNILSQERVRDAWNWLVNNISPRPAIVVEGQCCIFDQKRWGRERLQPLIGSDRIAIEQLSTLYLTSLLGDISDIRSLSMGIDIAGIQIYQLRLEENFRNLLEGDHNPENERDRYKRFRHTLSEHLAFWVQLSHLSQIERVNGYGISYANFLPDDRGPDGLSLVLDTENYASVELRSVKSSIINPSTSVIASGGFKQNGVTEDGKLLDEFYKVAYEGYGFRKLEAMLDFVRNQLNITIDQESRAGLLGFSTKYNGMVIADDRHARYRAFDCFHKVHVDPTFCIATYIGADNWVQLANQVHNGVIQILNEARVL